ncbi:MAG TPA: class I SAM-dependent methyltransferase [Candidatus Baltobacteraceae bacterium]|nr:class I SAM-dependent methyltransferase [Candidatus Baltobacteraceae bacterium]
MTDEQTNNRTCAAIAAQVHDFYEQHPYPPPRDDLEAYRRAWDEDRRRAESFLFWPNEPYRDDRSVLVAGCGTMQAARYAVRWPRARVVGIDVSEASIAFTEQLKAKYALDNLELRPLGIESAAELGETFEHVVCTGVLHHLPDPDAGLHALRNALARNGALNVMVYAPYGRSGIYMLQEYCRRIGAGTTDDDIRDLASSLRPLPQDHPIVPLLRNSPDFATTAGLADALLHPNDRAYSVPQFMDFLRRGKCSFGRWIRQAPYLPNCGAIASTPHAARLQRLPRHEQFAAMELFRGTMVRHAAVAYRDDESSNEQIEFEADAWSRFIPVRLPDTIVARENLPPGCVAVLVNRNHTYNDLYLPVDAPEERWLERIDGKRTIAEIAEPADLDAATCFFRRLEDWDQITFCR